ncbi:MAG: Uma2 family endonuclease [Gloeotrichia echinulata IR180]|jgi:Uma2 family endonuclease|nr:Uma2 family endonuclease [Gloeotrichia echinulata DEX184]
MTQSLAKSITFDDFIEWYPEKSRVRYELHDGIIIEMTPPSGDHELIVAFLAEKITLQYANLKLPYGIPKTAFIKPQNRNSAYNPDILLLNFDNLKNEPLWKKESTLTQSASIPLVVEIVSTNWHDDYHDKFAVYEKMGILEYWIVDYAALGGRKFIGNPKLPTFFVCELVDGEYQMKEFRGNSLIESPLFPQLNITVQQVFEVIL